MNATDQATFQNGLSLAQAGQKDAAYAQFKTLAQTYPDDINLLLWIVFTTPYLIEAEKNLERAAAIAPTHPSVAAAYTWLATERERREAEEQSRQEAALTVVSPAQPAFTPDPQPTWGFDRQQLLQTDLRTVEQTAEAVPPDAPNMSDGHNATLYPMPNVYSSTQPRTRGSISGMVWIIMAVLVAAIIGLTIVLVANGNKSTTIPASGQWTGDLALLEKVLRASDNYHSLKMSMTSNVPLEIEGKSITELSGTVVRPDHIQLHWTQDGQGTDRIFIGTDLYENANGGGWRKGMLVGANIQDIMKSVNNGSISLDKMKTWGGSTVNFKSDETVDGIALGVIDIDTSTGNTSAAKDLKGNKLTLKYDKKTLRLVREEISGGLFDMGHAEIHYWDYDSPNNHVDPPAKWVPA